LFDIHLNETAILFEEKPNMSCDEEKGVEKERKTKMKQKKRMMIMRSRRKEDDKDDEEEESTLDYSIETVGTL
jgi:hypothetical protein